MAAVVELYTRAHCPYCDYAKQFLQQQGVAYQEHRVDLDPSLRDVMLARSEGRRTFPQVVIGETAVGGYSDLRALHDQGKLGELLESAAVGSSS